MREWLPWVRPPQLRRLQQGIIDLSPPRVLALAFALLALLGMVLLKTPWATRTSLSWLDALFTAMSAVTVTGLVVVDTGTVFTLFGQSVLLVLIQLGGVGFMSFAVLILQLLGGRIGLHQQIILREALNHTSLGSLMQLVKVLLAISLTMEAVGMLILTTQWVPEFGLWEGLYRSLFYAVSAFNNAGFALDGDSLSNYAGNPVINLSITVLFITGGLGFAVLADLYHTRRFRSLSLHTKLMLTGSLILIPASMLLILLLEWRNPGTLAGMESWGERLWAAWFQAVTPRSAGFNTLDIEALHPATVALLTGLMFIGGGSSSTAGGIKLTTFIVLILATRAVLRQQSEPVVFGRAIGPETVLRALAITVISLMAVAAATFLLTITEAFPFQDILFEVMSGFATVGLSRGLAPELSEFGRGVIIVCMFVGRLGPLTLAFILTTRRKSSVQYSHGEVYIG